jgi:hypothetical protein
MRLPTTITNWLAAGANKIARSRPHDFTVGAARDPYMLRWWVIPRNKVFNIYLHNFMRSDDDEALHDHPWAFNLSIIVHSEYHRAHDCGRWRQSEADIPGRHRQAPDRTRRASRGATQRAGLDLLRHRAHDTRMGVSLPQGLASLERILGSARGRQYEGSGLR